MNNSSFRSGFEPSVIDELLRKEQEFPQSPATLDQNTRLFIVSGEDTTFTDVVDGMRKLCDAIKKYKFSVPSGNYNEMLIALELVPSFEDVMQKASEGMPFYTVIDHYLARLKSEVL